MNPHRIVFVNRYDQDIGVLVAAIEDLPPQVIGRNFSPEITPQYSLMPVRIDLSTSKPDDYDAVAYTKGGIFFLWMMKDIPIWVPYGATATALLPEPTRLRFLLREREYHIQTDYLGDDGMPRIKSPCYVLIPIHEIEP